MKNRFGCIACGAIPTMYKVCGLRWCEDCLHRAALIERGQRCNWPALCRSTYALAEGQFHWLNVATFGKDEHVHNLLVAINEYERRAA